MLFGKKDDKKASKLEKEKSYEALGLTEAFVKDLEAQFGEISEALLPEFVGRMIEANVLCQKIEKLTENMSPEDQHLITHTWPDFVSGITSRYGLRTELVPEAANVVYNLARKYNIVKGEAVDQAVPTSSGIDSSDGQQTGLSFNPDQATDQAMERVLDEKEELEEEASKDVLDSLRNNLDRI
jgi:hypothetical protein